MSEMESMPVIERQCKHSSKKVVRREILESFFITAINLCNKCKNDPEFSKNIEFVDKKIKQEQKLKTKTQIKKTIVKRKGEIETLKQKKKELWEIPDVMKKTPILLEYYIALEVLHEELERLYEKYVEKLVHE